VCVGIILVITLGNNNKLKSPTLGCVVVSNCQNTLKGNGMHPTTHQSKHKKQKKCKEGWVTIKSDSFTTCWDEVCQTMSTEASWWQMVPWGDCRSWLPNQSGTVTHKIEGLEKQELLSTTKGQLYNFKPGPRPRELRLSNILEPSTHYKHQKNGKGLLDGSLISDAGRNKKIAIVMVV